jgi:hypothetical protein
MAAGSDSMSDGLRERDQEEVGDRRLTLVSLLGTAPTSRTWLAVDASSALCVVRRVAGTSERERSCLLSSLAVAGGLRHPSLLPPTQAWAHGSAVWVARPHDDGASLRRLLAVARLTPRQLAVIGADALAGLDALHRAGLAHGRLHPGNILLCPEGRVRVTDAGLSAGAEGGSRAGEVPTLDSAARAADIEAVATALRGALAAPRHHPAASGALAAAALAEDAAALEGLLGPREASFGGAGSAEGARAALLAAFADAREPARRELAALVAPLRGERLGPALRELTAAASRPAPLARGRARTGECGLPAPPAAGEAADVPSPPRGRRPPLGQRLAGGWERAGRAADRARRGAGGGVAAAGATGRRALGRGTAAGRRLGAALSGLGTRSRAVAHRVRTGYSRRDLGALLRPSQSARGLLWGVPLMAAAVIAVGGLADGAVPSPPPGSTAVAERSPSAAPSPSSPPAAAATARATPAVAAQPPAPPTAGDVTGVELAVAGTGGCSVAAGSSCVLQVRVLLAPHAVETVSWELMAVDRCSGAAATLPGASIDASPGYAFVWADSRVTFSTADPLILYAVSTAPARAASPGLPLAGGGCS